VREFCDALDIDRPVVQGHSLGTFVALVYAARHPAHPRALVLDGAFARFDLDRITEEFRRAGGDEVADIARRAYSDQSETAEEWARCWELFGRWVPGDDERARTVVNRELNVHGLALMRSFDVLDDLARRVPDAPRRRQIRSDHALSASREIVESAGHFTWRDAPESYWPLVAGFVSQSLEQ